MSMPSNKDITFRIVDTWSDSFLEKMAAFAQARPEITPWQNRWLANPDYYRWKFAKNPAAPAVGAFAFDGEALVGSAVVDFKWAQHNGARILVGEIGDLYVSEHFRSQGIFRRLAVMATARAAERGAELVYCVPNQDGHSALLKTGAYEDVPAAQHRTWLLPLKPIGFLATRLPAAKLLAGLDPVFAYALRTFIGRTPNATMIRPEDLTESFPPKESKSSFRVSMTRDFFRYRILDHPARESYFSLKYPALTEHFAGGILKKTGYGGSTAFLLTRVMAPDPAVFAAVLRASVSAVARQDAAFLALWAPATGPIARILRRNLFVPVQTKSVALARYTSAQLKTGFAHLHIDMLDSDKA